MDNNNEQKYKDIEKNIKESLAEGLNTGDFSKLSAAISESAKEVVKDAGNAVNQSLKVEVGNFKANYQNFSSTTDGKKLYNNRQETQAYAQMLQARRKAYNAANQAMRNNNPNVAMNYHNRNVNSVAIKDKNLPVKFEPVGRGSGNACIAIGGFGLVVFGSAAIQNGLALITGAGRMGGFISTLVFALGFATVLKIGIDKKELYSKAKRYAQIAGLNMYAQVSLIASKMGTTTKKVKKDIKKMLRKGFFPEGYLDDEETTLMLSDNVYKQYQSTKSYALNSQAEQVAKNLEDDEDENLSKLDPEQRKQLKALVMAGNDYIARLHKLNEDIPGEEITRKLYNLENILKEIFRRVKEHPEQMDRMQKLMDYYLPTMIKLVEAYAEYDKVSTPGKDIIDAKKEIEQTLDTINEAFVQLLNNLFQDSVWDVTTDAQVLKTMLKQEGLAKDLNEG